MDEVSDDRSGTLYISAMHLIMYLNLRSIFQRDFPCNIFIISASQTDRFDLLNMTDMKELIGFYELEKLSNWIINELKIQFIT